MLRCFVCQNSFARFQNDSNQLKGLGIIDPPCQLREQQLVVHVGKEANDVGLEVPIVAPQKPPMFDFTLTFCVKNFIEKTKSGVEKSNVGNRLKRVLAKFRADRSHPRGKRTSEKTN